MIKAWIDSPTHRENLLRREFVNQGMAALYGDYQGRYTNLTTNLFGALALAQRPVAPTESTKPQVKSETPANQEFSQPAPKQQTEKIEPTKPTETSASVQPPLPEKAPLKPLPIFEWSRTVFTAFGIFMLLILSIDSIIVNRRELAVYRSHSSYHFFGFTLIVLVSILIWWW